MPYLHDAWVFFFVKLWKLLFTWLKKIYVDSNICRRIQFVTIVTTIFSQYYSVLYLLGIHSTTILKKILKWDYNANFLVLLHYNTNDYILKDVWDKLLLG